VRRAAQLAAALAVLLPALPAAAASAASLPPIRHVFIIVLENESASTSFGANSPAPYLAKTLTSEGAYLPNYHAIGHESNDNYIAMISGQAPNPQNQGDCQIFDDLEPGTIGSYGQATGQGCVFPADVPTIAGQLDRAGLTWRDYNQSMGADPTREAGVCAHPGVDQPDNTQSATAADQYATRHNPFVYFHSIIDDTTLCDTHVVNLNLLPQDLQSAASTPNYVFITPDLCGDGHDATCANSSRPGGFAGIQQFLQQWVPMITGSPAFKTQNGLLIVTFDEADTSDTSSCCGEIAGPNSPSPGVNGPGGGDTGAVLLSPCIKPGTVSDVAYNHYSMLRSVEDIFGLAHIGYAQLPGEVSFGSDIFNRPCGSVPLVTLGAPALASSASSGPTIPVRWKAVGADAASAKTFTVQVERTSSRGGGWRTLLRASTKRTLRFRAREGATYRFRVRANGANGLPGSWTTATTVVPSPTRVPGARYRGSWRRAPLRDGWNRHALIGARGASMTLRFRGGTLELIGSVWPQGGLARVTVDGRTRTINLHSRVAHARRVVYRAALRAGSHRLTVRVIRGPIPIEGVGILNRRG
jgi:phosphatidylinositol-3-phosphatase